MAWNKEKDLQLKYQYIPDEPIPHKKKRQKKKTKRSNHKHDYIPCYFWGKSGLFGKDEGDNIYEGSYCSICGKIGNFIWVRFIHLDETDKLEEIKKKIKLHQSVDRPVIYLSENFNCIKDKFVPLP